MREKGKPTKPKAAPFSAIAPTWPLVRTLSPTLASIELMVAVNTSRLHTPYPINPTAA